MTPGHTITITPASVHVVVVVNGEKVAESDRAMALDETGLPTRYYLPRDDVRADVLTPSNDATTCPFKGQASYWSVERRRGIVRRSRVELPDPDPRGRGHQGTVLLLPRSKAST